VSGSARHPLNTAEFSAFLLQAQASGAKVVALANAGGDMVNATKQADEFGLTRAGQTVVSLLTFITDVNSVGLKAMQGLTFITAFYWDRDDESRAWSKRFFELHKRMPTMAHAAIYSAVRHYLRAIEAAGTDEAKAVMAKMRENPRQRFLREEREGTRSRPHGARHVLRAAQNAGGIERPVGLIQESCRPFRASFSSLDEGECPPVKQR
jgi:branched-chain amino acid transport system substrate-binding protein